MADKDKKTEAKPDPSRAKLAAAIGAWLEAAKRMSALSVGAESIREQFRPLGEAAKALDKAQGAVIDAYYEYEGWETEFGSDGENTPEAYFEEHDLPGFDQVDEVLGGLREAFKEDLTPRMKNLGKAIPNFARLKLTLEKPPVAK